MFQDFRIAVIIPALNEAPSLLHVLGAIPDCVDDVIVADNGSTDGTPEIANRCGARVVFEPQRGYGAACLTGIAAASDADILVFLDADFSDHPEQTERLLEPIAGGDADMVIGSRTRGESERGALTVVQRWGNALSCFLIRRLWRFRYSDLGPFRAVRAAALECLRMDDRTYGWTVQMQIRALRAGLHVTEVPVDYRRRIGRSKISGTLRGVVAAGTKILSTVAAERFRPSAIDRYPVATEHLIVFSRYPAPGRTKTRLIPALGPEAAANLHRQMIEQTLLTADRLRSSRGASVEVRHTGGDRSAMAQCFGDHRCYLQQRGGDLGERMHRAACDAFDRGAERVVIIGTDCPALSPDTLASAFDELGSNDCVIGPARDGGYYLIGMRRPCPELFAAVEWGSSTVFDQTMRNAAACGLTVHALPPLQDVDEPDDLVEWEEHRPPALSVIIPALNEALRIRAAIDSARPAPDVEVVVVDGGSADDTPQIASSAGARVILAPPGRARQMNAGAAVARGSTLLFLHADTRLPADYRAELSRARLDENTILSAFRLGIDGPGPIYRWIERLANFRSHRFQLPYGDQAIAIRAADFHRLGGYRDLPIMEDYDFVRRARRWGRVKIAPSSVITSDRRWRRRGAIRLTLIHQLCIAAFRLGVAPDRIARWRGNGKS